ncbi:ADP-ribose glycohydrolase ARH3 [Balamuthia mandrillaris]
MESNRNDSYEDRCVGCFLGAMVGDILGAPVEGYSAARIRAELNGRPLRDFIDPKQAVGVVRVETQTRLQRRKLQLRALAELFLLQSARTTPTPKPGLMSMLLLLPLLLLKEDTLALRPKLFEALLLGEEDYRETGRRRFSEGSTSNGGAMRIAPIGLAFRNLLLHYAPSSSPFSSSSSSSSFSSSSSLPIIQHQQDEEEQTRRKQKEDDEDSFRQAVRTAILSTHVHPDAVDAATVLARCVALCALTPASSVSELRPERVLKFARDGSRSVALRSRLDLLIKALSQPRSPQQKEGKGEAEGDEEHMYDKQVLNSFSEWFQLKAVDAVATALWMFVRHGLPASSSSSSYCSSKPEECLIRTIAIGGDCDTIGCMVGALLGALLGAAWLPERWLQQMENGERGRDHAVELAKRFSRLDLRIVSAREGGEEREDKALNEKKELLRRDGRMALELRKKKVVS